MIKRNLKIFSQNVRKNKVLTDIILETQKNSADIIFIQESPRFLIQHIPSHSNPMGDPLYSTPIIQNGPYSFVQIQHKKTMHESPLTSINTL